MPRAVRVAIDDARETFATLLCLLHANDQPSPYKARSRTPPRDELPKVSTDALFPLHSGFPHNLNYNGACRGEVASRIANRCFSGHLRPLTQTKIGHSALNHKYNRQITPKHTRRFRAILTRLQRLCRDCRARYQLNEFLDAMVIVFSGRNIGVICVTCFPEQETLITKTLHFGWIPPSIHPGLPPSARLAMIRIPP